MSTNAACAELMGAGVRAAAGVPVRTPMGVRVRWERVVALTLLVLLAATILSAATGLALRAGGPATAGTPRGDGAVVEQTPALVEHTVVPGDTLWAIASGVDPAADPRPMLDRIMRLNNLGSGEVALGDVILVPARP